MGGIDGPFSLGAGAGSEGGTQVPSAAGVTLTPGLALMDGLAPPFFPLHGTAVASPPLSPCSHTPVSDATSLFPAHTSLLGSTQPRGTGGLNQQETPLLPFPGWELEAECVSLGRSSGAWHFLTRKEVHGEALAILLRGPGTWALPVPVSSSWLTVPSPGAEAPVSIGTEFLEKLEGSIGPLPRPVPTGHLLWAGASFRWVLAGHTWQSLSLPQCPMPCPLQEVNGAGRQ